MVPLTVPPALTVAPPCDKTVALTFCRALTFGAQAGHHQAIDIPRGRDIDMAANNPGTGSINIAHVCDRPIAVLAAGIQGDGAVIDSPRPQRKLHNAPPAGLNVAFRSIYGDVPDLARVLARNQLWKTGGHDAAARNNIVNIDQLPLRANVGLYRPSHSRRRRCPH